MRGSGVKGPAEFNVQGFKVQSQMGSGCNSSSGVRMDLKAQFLLPPKAFAAKLKIEYLARRDLFGQAHAFLGEIDGAAHPRVVEIAQSAETAEL